MGSAKVNIHWGEPSLYFAKKCGMIYINQIDELVMENDKHEQSVFPLPKYNTSLNFTLKLTRTQYIKFYQKLGKLKAPKCSYRTIKRNCAKRNIK